MLFLTEKFQKTHSYPFQIVGRKCCCMKGVLQQNSQIRVGTLVSFPYSRMHLHFGGGSLELFIRWHTKTLLMTAVHSEPSIKHVCVEIGISTPYQAHKSNLQRTTQASLDTQSCCFFLCKSWLHSFLSGAFSASWIYTAQFVEDLH